MRVHSAKGACLALAILGLCVGKASAQQFNRVVGFGDSLTDQGNVATAAGGAVPSYLPAFQLQQFSNGPTWITQLFGPSTNFFTTANPNAGNVNFAFGGAETSTPVLPGIVAAQPVTVQTQINAYLGAGGRFGANDLVSLWGGANNIFDLANAVQGGAISQAAAIGAAITVTNAAAADIGNQTRQIANAGARTILVFNLPGFGVLPSFNTNAQNAQLAELSTSNFNQALQGQLTAAAAASPNANIISVPVDQIFRAILANPASFGFANVTQGCVLTPSCAANPAQYNTFLFWDGVHPTQAGHALIAATALQYLQAPSRAALVDQSLSDTAFALRRTASLDAAEQLGRVTPSHDKWHFFIYGTGDAGKSRTTTPNGILPTAGTASVNLNDYATGGVRLGGLRGIGNGITLGAAFYFTTGALDGGARFADGSRQFKLNVTQIGGDFLARWNAGNDVFVNFVGGASFDRYNEFELRTVGPLRNRADPSGYSASVLGEVGKDFKFGALTLTPKGRIEYLRTTIDPFTEDGIVAPVAYNSRVVDGVTGAFELRAAFALNAATTLRALVGYEDFLAGSGGRLNGRLINNTAQPFAVQIRDPIGAGVIFGGGFDLAFGNVVARANYRGSAGERGQVLHQGTLGASFKF